MLLQGVQLKRKKKKKPESDTERGEEAAILESFSSRAFLKITKIFLFPFLTEDLHIQLSNLQLRNQTEQKKANKYLSKM